MTTNWNFANNEVKWTFPDQKSGQNVVAATQNWALITAPTQQVNSLPSVCIQIPQARGAPADGSGQNEFLKSVEFLMISVYPRGAENGVESVG